jgi:hypothetical protein
VKIYFVTFFSDRGFLNAVYMLTLKFALFCHARWPLDGFLLLHTFSSEGGFLVQFLCCAGKWLGFATKGGSKVNFYFCPNFWLGGVLNAFNMLCLKFEPFCHAR